MATKIVARQDKSALVSGLTWQPLTLGEKKRSSEIRDILANTEATKIALITSHGNTMLGLFSPEEEFGDTDANVKAPARLLSIALAFALIAKDENAVLAFTLPDDSAMSVIVVVEAGRPLLDDVKSTEAVNNLAKDYASGSSGLSYQLYSNDLGSFASGQDITEEDLWNSADKSTQLINKPIDFRSLIVGLTVLLIVGGGIYGYTTYQKAEARKKMIAAQKAADPTLRYEAELATKIGALGFDGPAAIEMLRSLGSYPTRQAGWALKSINCVASGSQCISGWIRQGGTTNELIAARKPYGEEIQGNSTNEESFFLIKTSLTPSGIASRDMLPAAIDLIAQTTPINQVLSNAGIDLMTNSDGYKVWPEVPGIASNSIPEAIAIKKRAVEFSTAMPLANQTLAALPKSFFWSEINIKSDTDSKDALGALTVTLKGNSYVR